MLKALILGFRQLTDSTVRRMLLVSVLSAVGTFAALLVAVAAGLGWLEPTGWFWVDGLIAVASSVGVGVLAWLLFPATFAAVLSLFADRVAEAVERRYYPGLPRARGMSVGQSILGALRFAAVAVLLNLLALPLYLLPGPNVLVYLALNGYLLGREYFEVVAGRRLDPASVGGLRRRARGHLWLAGVMIAGLLMVPLLNLVAPVVAIAFMVHLFERLRASDSATGRANRAGFDQEATEVFDFVRLSG